MSADDFKDTFKREAAMLCKLNHPSIVKFYGVCFMNSKFHLVTEYCPSSLYDLILVSDVASRGAIIHSACRDCTISSLIHRFYIYFREHGFLSSKIRSVQAFTALVGMFFVPSSFFLSSVSNFTQRYQGNSV